MTSIGLLSIRRELRIELQWQCLVLGRLDRRCMSRRRPKVDTRNIQRGTLMLERSDDDPPVQSP